MMVVLDNFITDCITLLRKTGIIKNSLLWGKLSAVLAATHYTLAVLFILLPVFPREMVFIQLLGVFSSGAIGFVWHRLSKKLLAQ